MTPVFGFTSAAKPPSTPAPATARSSARPRGGVRRATITAMNATAVSSVEVGSSGVVLPNAAPAR